jgi:hypothetical protein
MNQPHRNIRAAALLALSGLVAATGCRAQAPPSPSGSPSPVYNKETGKLEQLLSDRDGDGKVDTRAFMDGTRIVRIEIDRNGDGRPDRWEYYSAPLPDGSPTVIERAEEANGPDATKVTRHEFYDLGVLRAVDDDTDADGRPDKWETYAQGRLAKVDMDLSGRGKPDHRLIYDESGEVTPEIDPKGTGDFVPVPSTEPSPARGPK